MKKSLTRTLCAGLLAVMIALALAACGGGGDDKTTPEKTENKIISTLSAVQTAFLKTGTALDEVLSGIEAGIVNGDGSLYAEAFALSVLPQNAEDSDGEPATPAAPTLDDLEGYFLVSYINNRIDEYFAKGEGTATEAGYKPVGRFAWLIDRLTALEERFAETEETVLTDGAVKYKKIEGGYEVINPIYGTDEGHKDEIRAYFKEILTQTDNGITEQSGMCDANGNAVSENLPAELSARYSFKATDGLAAMDIIGVGGYVTFRLEVAETADGSYIQAYQDALSIGAGGGMSTDMRDRWNEYVQSDTEENLHLPRNPYIRFKLSADKQTGTMKVIRDMWRDIWSDMDIQSSYNTVWLPESWAAAFNAETALSFGDLIYNGVNLAEEYATFICTFNYYAVNTPEEK